MRGDVLVYAAQTIPPIDAEIAENGHLWTETISIPSDPNCGGEYRMNFNELADYIGLKPQTIRNKFYAGEFPIPAKKIFSKVLWDKKDVDKYLDKLPKIDC